MRNSVSMNKLLNHDRGFWAIAFALMVVMAYSAFPTPLYGLYAARDGFGALTITAVFAAYAVGVDDLALPRRPPLRRLRPPAGPAARAWRWRR